MLDHDALVREIREALEKATPWPWLAWNAESVPDWTDAQKVANANLIAHAPEWLSKLLTAYESQERDNDDLRLHLHEAEQGLADAHGERDDARRELEAARAELARVLNDKDRFRRIDAALSATRGEREGGDS